MRWSTDVLVLGAGPTGLALACDLRRRGVDCRVVDRRPGPPSPCRPTRLGPGGVEVLDDLAVWPEGDPGTPARWRLEELLHTRLAELGGTVDRGWALVDLEQDDDGVTATVAAGSGRRSEIRALHVVGCDGAAGRVRSAAGLPPRADAGGPGAARYREGRVLLAGAAARGHAAIGTGVDLGLQDAHNLGWKLHAVLHGRAGEDLLDTYALERGAAADPGSGRREDPERALEVGDRARDAPGTDADTGAPTRLRDLLRGPHFTLLLFAGPAAGETVHSRLAATARQVVDLLGDDVRAHVVVVDRDRPATLGGVDVLLDPGAAAHRAFGVPAESLYLVRPDGCVAVRSGPATAEPVLAYLDATFPPSPPAFVGLLGMALRGPWWHCPDAA